VTFSLTLTRTSILVVSLFIAGCALQPAVFEPATLATPAADKFPVVLTTNISTLEGPLGLDLEAFAEAPPGLVEEIIVKTEEGTASWYGPRFHGRRTANGERFDMHDLTAAHRKLPFNSLARVTCLSTGEQVVVRINDRGPYAKNRTLDLSRAAAEKLGMIDRGVTRVKIEVLASSL
jgi:rare lipoprotein A